LETACEALDRQKQAAEAIETHGVVLVNEDTGQIRPNPACVVERDSRAAMLSALRALRLDIEIAPGKPGRPPGR